MEMLPQKWAGTGLQRALKAGEQAGKGLSLVKEDVIRVRKTCRVIKSKDSGLRYLGSNPSPTTDRLCDLGQLLICKIEMLIVLKCHVGLSEVKMS